MKFYIKRLLPNIWLSPPPPQVDFVACKTLVLILFNPLCLSSFPFRALPKYNHGIVSTSGGEITGYFTNNSYPSTKKAWRSSTLSSVDRPGTTVSPLSLEEPQLPLDGSVLTPAGEGRLLLLLCLTQDRKNKKAAQGHPPGAQALRTMNPEPHCDLRLQHGAEDKVLVLWKARP